MFNKYKKLEEEIKVLKWDMKCMEISIQRMRDTIFGEETPNRRMFEEGWITVRPISPAISNLILKTKRLEKHLGIEWKEEKVEGYKKIKKLTK